MSLASEVAGHALASYRDEFPVFRESIYLNTCSLGALGERSRRKVRAFLDEWSRRGAAAWYDVWWDALARLRADYGALVGADEGEIALAPSISVALNAVAESLDYGSRPRIVTTALDFPAIIYPWLARERDGVEVVIVETSDGVTVPVDAIAAAVDERTALVATSHVYFTTGAIQDIKAIAELSHEHGALCFIDAYQSAGQVPIDVRTDGVDFLAAGGLKWLLGGPGTCFLYARAEMMTTLSTRTVGWFAHRDQFAFDPYHFSPHLDARRFETGTPALAAVHAQLGGLDLINEIGVMRIREVTSDLAEDLIARARGLGLTPRVAATAAERSAIVPIQHPAPSQAVTDLATHGIIVDARPGVVRLSPFFYNVSDDYVAALERLSSRT